ncbi:LPXTG cell wall anchor domain-containing protein [Enterococcus sp. AZ126]|uniref:LPXTG cell wall anchor domain-containing protein n=1 Tax=Enterococcus sp. AZ126 TaxID=2774635 RepID=UPI003F22F4AA
MKNYILLLTVGVLLASNAPRDETGEQSNSLLFTLGMLVHSSLFIFTRKKNI